VNGCTGCVFNQHCYNDYSNGYDTIEYCNLSKMLGNGENIIKVYDSFNNGEKTKTPTWCPLKNGDLVIRFRDDLST